MLCCVTGGAALSTEHVPFLFLFSIVRLWKSCRAVSGIGVSQINVSIIPPRYLSAANVRFCSSLSCDLVLPLWKSNVSVTLMIDKKAKRCEWCVGLHTVRCSHACLL